MEVPKDQQYNQTNSPSWGADSVITKFTGTGQQGEEHAESLCRTYNRTHDP